AAVRSGLVLSRKQAREATKYRYRLLNLRSVNSAGYIDVESTDLYNATEPLNPEYLSHEGDVIIRLSAPYTAVLIDDTTSDMVISSNFAIVRPELSCLLPEYLYWLLNTPKVKRQIFENTSSNMLGAVKPRYFADFEVSPLSVESQAKIAVLNRLAHREYQLLNELVIEKEKYYSYAMNEIQKQMRRGIRHDD
ncbi:MAG: restriction endonuclease subunit S, partial [Clostridia bacterium]